MRVNVYYEEMTTEVRIVEKTSEGKTFWGVRQFLVSPTTLHYKIDDDDRSAVTFWFTQEADAKAMLEALFVASRHAR